MSGIYHQLYNDMAPSFEALVQEFVIEPLNLDPKSRESRRNQLLGYFNRIYDNSSKGPNKNKALRLAYDETRKWAQNVYVLHHIRKAEKQKEELKKQPDLFLGNEEVSYVDKAS